MESKKTYCLCGQPYNPKKFMLQCDNCKDWFHGGCVNIKEYESIEIDKYYCPKCNNVFGTTTYKALTNWHRHDSFEPNPQYKPVQTGTEVFIRELCSRHFSTQSPVITYQNGTEITEELFASGGFQQPLLVSETEGLDLMVPPITFSVSDVELFVGGEREIDVIDVTRQEDIKMTLHEFVEYYNSANKTRTFNVISLEFSDTKMSSLVEPPAIARQVDWVATAWDNENTLMPRVAKYCLMSVKDSYTDFHIDFGGTSVWYHVLKGEKVFYFIKPIPANLTLYQQWMTSSTQNETFFGDQVDKCYKCVLRQGETMFIPTGWIHAVYTPEDSIVFGGNFLHSYNIPMQLQVFEIEKKTKAAVKFRYPYFEMMNWYAAKMLLTQLIKLNVADQPCPEYLLSGIKSLINVLKQWNSDKDVAVSRDPVPETVNSHKLLKDLSKEVRHAERIHFTLNPPKPERESKRKRKKPWNKDYVDISGPANKLFEQGISERASSTSPPGSSSSSSQRPLKLTVPRANLLPELSPSAGANYVQPPPTPPPSQLDYDLAGAAAARLQVHAPQQPRVMYRGGTVLKFSLGSKNRMPNVLDPSLLGRQLDSVYDFTDDKDEDDFGLQIDESPPKKRKSDKKKQTSVDYKNGSKNLTPPPSGDDLEMPDTPKNGIESLLKASVLTNKYIESGRASPSTREAIVGMLSIGQSGYVTEPSTAASTLATSTPAPVALPLRVARKKKTVSANSLEVAEENVNKVHQDDEYIYPSLDHSDDEEMYIFKPRGRAKQDEAWNPKARVGPLQPKVNRPAREGVKKQSVEKVLKAAAAKRAGDTPRGDAMKKAAGKKRKQKSPRESLTLSSSGTRIGTSILSPAGKPRKGMKTAKQRLGKIIKIHKMIH